MNRAIVLFLCLAGAAGIAAHTYYARDAGEPTAVYTVPQRAAEPVVKPSAGPPPKAIETPGDRVSLTRALQFELKRVGCYSGDVNGVWTTSSRMAMKSFTDHVNATLPIDSPDYVLLSLVKGHQDRACGRPCPTSIDGAPCAPGAVLAKGTKVPAPTEAKADASSETSGTMVAAGAAAAAAVALATPKPGPKAAAPDDRPRPTAAAPQQEGPPPGKSVQREGYAKGGPVPSEGVYEPGSRRSKGAEKRATSRPPKFVRDFLRSFGIK